MTTQEKTYAAALERRIRQFYAVVNDRDFEKCYAMIDPKVREDPASVTFLQYQQSLESFLNYYGTVEVRGVRMHLHLGEPSQLYGNRDFAVGQLTWTDEAGEEHVFQERWVRVGRHWYTRLTGLVTPSVKRFMPQQAEDHPD
jgi:hypothetical protein